MPKTPAAVLWDVDGTLVESTTLAFDATNEVLAANKHPTITVDEYKVGCRYTTPARFNHHIGLAMSSAEGVELGKQFDETYVCRVSSTTAGLFPGLLPLLNELATAGHLGALSNACGAYVSAVMKANKLGELFRVSLGADEVLEAKPLPGGLVQCCEALGVMSSACVYIGDSPSDGQAARAAGMRSVGVLWGANSAELLRDHFDVLAADVSSLREAIATCLS